MIKKVENGYKARVYYKSNGKRTSVNKTFLQRRMAETWERDMKIAIQATGRPFIADVTFTDYFWTWYKTYRQANLAPATIDRYKTIYNVLLSHFAGKLLRDITRMDYQKFLNDYADSHAKASVEKIHHAVKAAITDAVDDDIIKKNFALRITIYGQDSMDPADKYLDMKDTENLMSDLENKIDVYSISYPMIYTALLTGMRLAEVQGLTEHDFFPKFKRIQINKTYNHVHTDPKDPFKPTKNKSSNRIVDIPDVLVNYLNTLIETQHKFNHVDNPHKLLFMNTRGDVPSSNGINKVLANELKHIKAKKIITFHGLRHTHASYLLAKGSKLEYVSKRLGHASIETTMNVYAHMLQETETDEISKAMNFFDKFSKTSESIGAQRIQSLKK